MVSLTKSRQGWLLKVVLKNVVLVFGDAFVSITKYDMIRLLIALAAHNEWKIFQLDVKLAFLNCLLEEEIFD